MCIFSMNTRRKKLISAGFLIVALLTAFFAYCLPYYHVQAVSDLFADEAVTVTDEGKYFFYDGPGTDEALIFYPGAKVDEQAYGPLMTELAEAGTDCFLVKMPLHIAIFGKNRANAIIHENNKYATWYMGGHSLGGSMAASYTAAHEDTVDGLVLLASFSTADLTDDENLKAVSVYGSCDKVLKMSEYEKNRQNLPADFSEVVIEGGNHAGFAYYGPQRGDGEAAISREEQIRETVEAIEEGLKQ